MKYFYKIALWIAAEQAYEDEIVQPGMEDIEIGDGKDYVSKDEWIQSRMQEWLDEANRRRWKSK